MTFPARLSELIEKATKGPWAVYDDSNDGKTNRIEIVAIGKTIAHIYRSVPTVDLPNALLIAYLVNHAEAIRELVAAAEQMQRAMNYTSGVSLPFASMELRKALAKLEEA